MDAGASQGDRTETRMSDLNEMWEIRMNGKRRKLHVLVKENVAWIEPIGVHPILILTGAHTLMQSKVGRKWKTFMKACDLADILPDLKPAIEKFVAKHGWSIGQSDNR